MRTIKKLQPFCLDVQVPSEDFSEYPMSNDKTPLVLLKVKTLGLKPLILRERLCQLIKM